MKREVFVTKYALTEGITRREVLKVYESGTLRVEGMSHTLLTLGRDCHDTGLAAVQAADASRLKKIAALKKQIAKLEAMTFVVEPFNKQ